MGLRRYSQAGTDNIQRAASKWIQGSKSASKITNKMLDTTLIPIPDKEGEEEAAAVALNNDTDFLVTDNMPSALPAKGTLAAALGVIVPDHATITKLRECRKVVANHLSTVKLRHAPYGLSYLVEDESRFQLRTGDSTTTLPEYPTMPMLAEEPTPI